MHSSTKKAAEPKRLTKNGKVYGDLLSAEEKKKLVLQKNCLLYTSDAADE